jgi:hypothetical protein
LNNIGRFLNEDEVSQRMNIGRRSKKEDKIPTHACDYGQI